MNHGGNRGLGKSSVGPTTRFLPSATVTRRGGKGTGWFSQTQEEEGLE